MYIEYICSTPNWRNEGPCHDCVFIDTKEHEINLREIDAYEVACVLAFFSFHHAQDYYACAIVRWFDKVRNGPDENTSMWKVCPAALANCSLHITIIHVEKIYHAAHLIPIYGNWPIPQDITPLTSYNTFHLFYINKYVNHHAFEMVN